MSKEEKIVTKVANGLNGDKETGLFEHKTIYIIKIEQNKEIRYRTAYELGYIVGYNRIKFSNPYDPINTEVDEFDEGLYAGREARNNDR